MNILYLGKYAKRFDPVISEIRRLPPGTPVLELCFGDIYIADFCKKNGFPWTGLDINDDFVEMARKAGFDARMTDVIAAEQLPTAGACIMMGSLYHFHRNTEDILGKMLQAADLIIISEPVLNLSARNGVIGWFAKKGANAGKGDEHFRYNRTSFRRMLEENSAKLGFRIEEVDDRGKDLIVKLTRK
ncbi:MAG TPA: hypothetical protein VFM90_05930 [Cyclobacteriaceae bacterium]|nr:hypothetical protein [Cyclobacteriaceae bacterium]